MVDAGDRCIIIGDLEESAMARPPSTQPTDGELEILKVLWEHGPSPLKRVCEGLRRGRPVATTTVATMLKLMLDKGLVERGEGEAGRGSVYSARVSREAASAGLVRRLVDLVFDGSARRLVAHMLENEKLGDRDRAEIRRLLDEDVARRTDAASPRKKGGRS
jgi:BlaI family penicillinase repressor